MISFIGTANSSSCIEAVNYILFSDFPSLVVNSSYIPTTISVSDCSVDNIRILYIM